MTINVFDLDNIQGSEDLSVGERLKLFMTELSVSVDRFNAKAFNKSIHTVKVDDVVKLLTTRNNYFNVSFKHIASPVFFDAKRLSFKDYVELVLQGIGALKLVNTQAEDLYRGLKQTAAKGQVVHSLRTGHHIVAINELRQEVINKIVDSKVYTRPVSELYVNWGELNAITQRFNQEVSTLKSRDAEVLSKNMDMVLDILKLIKRKVDDSEIILNDLERSNLNEAIKLMDENAKFVGEMLTYITELTSVFGQQVEQLKKLS